MLKSKTAVKICSNWHGGQWSAFYQFASSGIYTTENHLRYLQEVETCLHPEYNLYPGSLSKKDTADLENLKQFFIMEGQKIGIYTQYGKSEMYGYLIPFIADFVPDSVSNTVKTLQYPI